MTYALDVEHLTVYYHSEPVVWDVSLQIPAGHLVGIIGPNGAGKSTFVKSLLSIVKPSSGRVLFYNQPFTKVKLSVAYVSQRNTVDWSFPITAFDVVLMGCYGQLGWLKRPTKAHKQKAYDMLAKLDMLPFADRQISQLSGGQQQRLFIARALMQEASIYFFDEPFAGIDHTTETFIMNLFKEMVKEGKTIFVIHHDLSSLHQYFDYGILLNTRLIDYGPIEVVLTKENLCETYGNKEEILEKALLLSKEKYQGY